MGVYDYHRPDEKPRELGYVPLCPGAPEVTRENPCKAYVTVRADFTADGALIPLSITWEDGRVYPIDRGLDVQRMASRKTGGAGIRYLCRVLGQSVELYYEENGHWFVCRREEEI